MELTERFQPQENTINGEQIFMNKLKKKNIPMLRLRNTTIGCLL